MNSTDITALIAELRGLLEETDRPPWKVYEQLRQINELGLKTFPAGSFAHSYVERRISTEYDHVQLEGPAPIITLSTSPYYEPNHAVHISDRNARLLVAAVNALPTLLDALAGAQKRLDDATAMLDDLWATAHERCVGRAPGNHTGDCLTLGRQVAQLRAPLIAPAATPEGEGR